MRTGSEETGSTHVPTIAGPFSSLLSRSQFPPPGTKRWVVRRKAEVVAGVRGGLKVTRLKEYR